MRIPGLTDIYLGDGLTATLNPDGSMTVEADGNGGSLPGATRMVDCGAIDAVALGTTGPQVLYDTQPGEVVFCPANFIGVVGSDPASQVGIGVQADFANAAADAIAIIDYALAYFDSDILPFASKTSLAVTDPVIAYWTTTVNGIGVSSAPGAWQANHLYAVDDWIIDSDDHLQQVTTGGTSGGSEPVWGNPTTTDGTVEWTDEGPIPTVGSATNVILLVSEPVAA